ncbi:hypothetical protein SO694_00137071 [Aureococcus anophagefferens]|uniref:Hook C-terminal domain-containing protein n=2 Tax=Aureococcus anophagefferens TaxID=44056 RepID=A0ABR1GGD9_AURAN
MERTAALESWVKTLAVDKSVRGMKTEGVLASGGAPAAALIARVARAIARSPRAKFSEAAYERWPASKSPSGAEASAAVEILLYCAACCDKSSKRGAHIQRILRLPQQQQQQLMGAMKAQMAAEREAQSAGKSPPRKSPARAPSPRERTPAALFDAALAATRDKLEKSGDLRQQLRRAEADCEDATLGALRAEDAGRATRGGAKSDLDRARELAEAEVAKREAEAERDAFGAERAELAARHQKATADAAELQRPTRRGGGRAAAKAELLAEAGEGLDLPATRAEVEGLRHANADLERRLAAAAPTPPLLEGERDAVRLGEAYERRVCAADADRANAAATLARDALLRARDAARDDAEDDARARATPPPPPPRGRATRRGRDELRQAQIGASRAGGDAASELARVAALRSADAEAREREATSARCSRTTRRKPSRPRGRARRARALRAAVDGQATELAAARDAEVLELKKAKDGARWAATRRPPRRSLRDKEDALAAVRDELDAARAAALQGCEAELEGVAAARAAARASGATRRGRGRRGARERRGATPRFAEEGAMAAAQLGAARDELKAEREAAAAALDAHRGALRDLRKDLRPRRRRGRRAPTRTRAKLEEVFAEATEARQREVAELEARVGDDVEAAVRAAELAAGRAFDERCSRTQPARGDDATRPSSRRCARTTRPSSRTRGPRARRSSRSSRTRRARPSRARSSASEAATGAGAEAQKVALDRDHALALEQLARARDDAVAAVELRAERSTTRCGRRDEAAVKDLEAKHADRLGEAVDEAARRELEELARATEAADREKSAAVEAAEAAKADAPRGRLGTPSSRATTPRGSAGEHAEELEDLRGEREAERTQRLDASALHFAAELRLAVEEAELRKDRERRDARPTPGGAARDEFALAADAERSRLDDGKKQALESLASAHAGALAAIRDLAERSAEAARGDAAAREVERQAALLERARSRRALEARAREDAESARALDAALADAADRERRAVGSAAAEAAEAWAAEKAALAAAVDDERAASATLGGATLESQIAYGKQYLKQKDMQLNAATAQINKLEREKKFLQASRDSPGGGGDRSNKTLEAAFEKLRKEYEGLSRTLNGKLAEEAAAAGLADHDQLRLYASKVQSLEARLQEKTMAAAVSERDAHDAKCAVDKLKVELTDAKFDITRLEASVARAELGRTPYVASARKPRSPAPPPSTPVSEHGFALHDDEAADLTVTLDTYVPPPKMGPTVQEQLAALRAERDANNAALAAPSPEPAKRPLTRAQRAAAAARKSPAVARKVSFAGVAAKENQAA